MTGNTTLSWSGGWPRGTWLSLGLGAALLFAGIQARGTVLCAIGGALAVAGIVSLRRKAAPGEVRITDAGVESGEGQHITFADIARISNAIGVRCAVSRETEGRDCWIEGTDGTHVHIPAAAGPDRRGWISSLSRWLEPAEPELPDPLKAAWIEESQRHGAAMLRGARVVPCVVLQKRGGSPVSVETLSAAAGALIAGGAAKLAGTDGSFWPAVCIALLLAIAGGAGLLLRRLQMTSAARDPGGVIISPSGIRILFQGKETSAPWSEVREASQQGTSLHVQAAGQRMVLPPVFSESAAELEKFIRQHLR